MKRFLQNITALALFAMTPLALTAAQDADFVPLHVEDADDYGLAEDDYAWDEWEYGYEQDEEEYDVYVWDFADILTNNEWYELNELAEDISRKHNLGVYVVVVDDYGKYAYSIEEASELFYDELNLGYDEERSGITLFMSMDDRSYDLDAFGRGNDVFTDYGKDVLAQEFLDNFRRNDWYGGFKDFITASEEFIVLAENGEPIDVNTNYGVTREASFMSQVVDTAPKSMMVVIPLALIIAFCILSGEKKKMNNIHFATEAGNYVQDDGITFNRKSDMFTHTTTSRVRIQNNDSRSSGGGGTTIHSSGHSHSSGHF